MASSNRPAVVFAVLTAVFAFALAAIAIVAEDGGGGSPVATEEESAAIPVSLTEFAVSPAMIHAGTDAPVTLAVTNDGQQVHNLTLRDGDAATADLESGGATDLDLGSLAAGDYELFCSIPGHEEAGMKADLMVMEGEGETTAAEGEGEMDYAAMSEAMNQTIAEFPAETEGVGNEPLEPTIASDGAKEYELTAAVTDWEVAAGQVVEAWSYNGIVPGPEIRVDVGDRVRVTVRNELPAPTDLHMHGVRLPNEMDGVGAITQDLIQPGEEFTYEFVAREPAVAMYHAHHMAQIGVPNGLFGTIFIGDVPIPRGSTIGGIEVPADLEVAQELPMVLNDAGAIGLSLNGKSFPATAPVATQDGDWLLIHYYNEGLQTHPMHLHQFPQLVLARDGIPLEDPYWADTLNVAPGERYSVLVHTDEPGTWVWHCHILNHVERESGHFGMLTAVVVE
jgi:uncharacterized cupredoxin-like copper-binding protein